MTKMAPPNEALERHFAELREKSHILREHRQPDPPPEDEPEQPHGELDATEGPKWWRAWLGQ